MDRPPQARQYPKVVTVGFNPSTEFHTYTIEWAPSEARFLVDGELLHTATQEMQRMVLPQKRAKRIRVQCWIDNSKGQLGYNDRNEDNGGDTIVARIANATEAHRAVV